MENHYDFVIVGSGFGGSVAALRLGEKGYRVAVIEMGRRWRPEDFPRSNWDLRRFLWMPALRCHGIQRMTLLNDMLVLSGVGVGGGSLVYANTLLTPPDEVWQDPRWAGLADWQRIMPAHYRTARRMLGATEPPQLFAADSLLQRYAERSGRGHTFQRLNVGVYFGAAGAPGEESPDPYFAGRGPARRACTLCGGCMIGCRVGAKNTLDRNYLYLAEHHYGVTIIPETRVTLVESLGPEQGYRLQLEGTTPGGRQRSTLCAAQVVLAGGVLGTVPLLLRCRERRSLPGLSLQLGNYVRSNSAALLGVTARDPQVDFSRGVAIGAGMHLDDVTHLEAVRYPDGSDMMGLLGTLLTDGGPGLPRALRWALSCLRRPRDVLRTLWPLGWARRTVILGVMQTLPSHMRMRIAHRWFAPDGVLTTENDQEHRNPSFIPAANRAARELAELIDGIPQSALNEVLLDIPTTAHILGGCPMGSGRQSGVIDHAGRVFSHPGLFVVDGSMIGANLGVNPALTITALAEHAMSQIPQRGAARPSWPA